MKDLALGDQWGTAEFPWPSWVEVDLDAIRHNVAIVRAGLRDGCQVMAVVKAQAYGHGALAVAKVALEAGAGWLGVARVREGIQLRDAGVDAPILLLGPMAPSEIPALVESQLRPTLVSLEQAEAVSGIAQKAGRVVRVHLKVETGMGRYGAPVEEMLTWLPAMAKLPGLQLEGIFSHFATADEEDGSYAATQLAAFQAARQTLAKAGYSFPFAHMAASAAILGIAESHMEMVRMGLSLYGLYPSPHLASRGSLRPALSLHSRVARVFRLKPGQSVGYGRTFVADRPMEVALIPIGYADGLPRSHSNRGFMLVNGRRAPILGRVSMDQCVVGVSDCGPVREGDPVVAIGSLGEESISCDEFAERSGTISYEIVTTLGFRLPRVYRSGGGVVAVGYLDEGRLESWQR